MTHRACAERLRVALSSPEGSSDVRAVPSLGTCAGVRAGPAAAVARTVPLVIGGLIATGLWLWMAWANGKGRSWARVVSAVFFGINTLDLLISLFLVHAVATTLRVYALVIWE